MIYAYDLLLNLWYRLVGCVSSGMKTSDFIEYGATESACLTFRVFSLVLSDHGRVPSMFQVSHLLAPKHLPPRLFFPAST